ncbi:oligosaccharide flippase family protein [Rhodococcus ruber]|uniref:oligosaccharide flippase family protein n=1 Tax=Rhodococcus ruber TaxID=1830 RepID=UPI0037843B73
MKSLAWSFVERIFPRAASALVMLGMTFFISPATVGVYTLAILAVTFFQSATDASFRQIAVSAIDNEPGETFLRLYTRMVPGLGALFIACALVLILAIGGGATRNSVLAMVPLVAIPLLTARRLSSVARMQKSSRWSTLAKFQFLAAIGSFVVSVPILLLTRSLLAPTMQLVLTELIFTISTVYHDRNNSEKTDSNPSRSDSRNITREFLHMSAYSILAWTQTQADRLLMGPIAGTEKLGQYSVATSIARSAGDAISLSSANVLRPQLLPATGRSASSIRSTVNALLLRSSPLALAASLATILGVEYLLRPILQPVWHPSLDAAVLLALTAWPTLISWCMTVVLLAAGRARWAPFVKAFGILLAVPIAIAAFHSIELAAIVVLGREVISTALMLAISGKTAPTRAVLTYLPVFIALTGIVALPLAF